MAAAEITLSLALHLLRARCWHANMTARVNEGRRTHMVSHNEWHTVQCVIIRQTGTLSAIIPQQGMNHTAHYNFLLYKWSGHFRVRVWCRSIVTSHTTDRDNSSLL